MYELEYVRKRKTRRILAIVGGISAVVVSSLSIVAFLGQRVGTFTVSLNRSDVNIALSDRREFKNETSFLRIGAIKTFQEYTYGNLLDLGNDVLDSQNYDYTIGANKSFSGKIISLNFLKYTFYVKNTGSKPCQYHFALNITDKKASTDGRYLDETLRIMFYENEEESSHQYLVYGKRSTIPHINENGDPDYRSPISIDKEDATIANPFMGYAEMFESTDIILSFRNSYFDVGEIKRYSIVAWLEGFRSSNFDDAPEGANIQLGVKINAYEIQ